jgi:exopolyphosphatase / guanosine-5'-triphosphate,3'-diphosphate pyrophosphatase
MARTGISETRLSLVPSPHRCCKELVKTFKPHDIAVSSYGIREGMLYEQMPQRLRDRDPLIEACRFAEEKDARLPGFGDQLYTFISPLFRSADAEKSRIIRAACLLHDVSWRAHPDYRHEACFDYATRANLGGLNHSERVYIGLALLHRYKNSREGSRFEPLYRLLEPEDLKEAEVLGKAMRFGAMFSGQVAERMGELRWQPKKKVLELRLARGVEALFGEVAEARFKSLVQALGATHKS